MKNIHKTLLLSALALASIGCSDKNPSGGGSSEEKLIEFNLPQLLPAALKNDITYGFMGYKGGSSNPEPENMERGVGTYRLNTTDRSTLIPCLVDDNGVAISDYTPEQGMKLPDGSFNIFMHSPGVPIVNNGKGSMRIKYSRDTKLKVALKSFPMKVADYKTYAVNTAGLTFTELRSDVSVNFLKKDANLEFEITNLRIINVGDSAYYHPLLRINEVLNPSTNHVSMALETTGNTGIDQIIYKTTAPEYIFPADYSKLATMELGLEFYLTIGINSPVKIVTPLAIEIKPSTHYTFNININSTFITVVYKASPWDEYLGPGDKEEVGSLGFKINIKTLEVSPWDPNGGNTSIDD